MLINTSYTLGILWNTISSWRFSQNVSNDADSYLIFFINTKTLVMKIHCTWREL